MESLQKESVLVSSMMLTLLHSQLSTAYCSRPVNRDTWCRWAKVCDVDGTLKPSVILEVMKILLCVQCIRGVGII